ncbi:hypothetical protein CHU98_g11983 [Xylaria longipes]|nr:hypothetical protein CHU98_g11983 [Xylaria longipes]
MASLGKLPAELALQVLRGLGTRDLAAIAATCRGYYALANPLLYKLEVQNPESYTFYAAAGSGHVGRMQKLIDAGFDVNQLWFSPFSGVRVEEIRMMDLWCKGKCSKEEVILHRQAESERHAKTAQFRYRRFDDVDYSKSRTNISDWEEYMADLEEDMADWEEDMANSEAPRSFGASRGILEVDHFYWAALHLAAANGQDEAVCFLIDKGANIDAPSKNFCECYQVKAYVTYAEDSYLPPWSPLHMAICRGHPQTAKLLLNRGASIVVEVDGLEGPEYHPHSVSADTSAATADLTPRPQNQNRCTALHAACFYGEYNLVKTLIEGGYQTQLEVEDIFGQTPLAHAFCAHQHDAIIPYLRSKGCDININLGNFVLDISPYPGSPLIMACEAYQYHDAIRLVELGADVNSINLQTNQTPLHICTPFPSIEDERMKRKRYTLIHDLLKAGANVNSVDEEGLSPLHCAAMNLDTTMAKALIQYGADVAARDFHGDTILALVSYRLCHLDIDHYEQELAELVNLLISHKADINARNDQNCTPLHKVCQRADGRVHLKILLSHGANATLRDNSGLLPFHKAFRDGQVELCSLLLNEQVKILLSEDDITDMLFSLLEWDGSDGLFNLLLDAGGAFLLSQPEALKMAFDRGMETFIPLIVDKKTFADFVSDLGYTMLHHGCRSGVFERKVVIAQLLESGVDFDADIMNEDGENLLSIYLGIAQKRDGQGPSHKTVNHMLKRGVDAHQLLRKVHYGYQEDYSQYERPLDIAISEHQHEIACSILQTHPVQGDTSGYSYLHRSCSFQKGPAQKELIHNLLQHGFDANGITCFGETPLFHMLHTFKLGLPSKHSSYNGLELSAEPHYMAVDHIVKLWSCINLLEQYGAKWSVRNKYLRDGRWTLIDELRHLLSYGGKHSRSRGELNHLRTLLRAKKWDYEDVGLDFFLFEQDEAEV